MEEKSFLQQIRIVPKVIGLFIGGLITYIVTSKAGFPPIFVWLFLGFVFACFLFFVILDLPEIKEVDSGYHAAVHLVVTFLVASAIYTVSGWAHPQFSPEFEIAKINTPPRKTLPTGPEAILAGYEVYMDNKCENCHKSSKGGSSDRGPDLFTTQVGIFDPDWVKEQVVAPRKNIHPGFNDPKAKKAMPTYFGEDITGIDMDLLLTFLGSQVNDKEMPKVGKAGSMTKWTDVAEKVAYGKSVFEGEVNEDVNCSVCHGKDATPVMQGAAEFKNPNWMSNKNKKPFKDYTDADLFDSIMHGVEDTPMMAWSELGLTREQAWGTVAYIRKQFQSEFSK
ncbi:MAG: c-type cytochrome [Nitrospinota bacterium]